MSLARYVFWLWAAIALIISYHLTSWPGAAAAALVFVTLWALARLLIRHLRPPSSGKGSPAKLPELLAIGPDRSELDLYFKERVLDVATQERQEEVVHGVVEALDDDDWTSATSVSRTLRHLLSQVVASPTAWKPHQVELLSRLAARVNPRHCGGQLEAVARTCLADPNLRQAAPVVLQLLADLRIPTERWWLESATSQGAFATVAGCWIAAAGWDAARALIERSAALSMNDVKTVLEFAASKFAPRWQDTNLVDSLLKRYPELAELERPQTPVGHLLVYLRTRRLESVSDEFESASHFN